MSEELKKVVSLQIELPPDEVASEWAAEQMVRFLTLQATKAIRLAVTESSVPSG